jgi:hypothetical protein
MRYQAKWKTDTGEIKTEILESDSWATAVNTVAGYQNLSEVLRVRNVIDVPPYEPVEVKRYKKSAWEKQAGY